MSCLYCIANFAYYQESNCKNTRHSDCHCANQEQDPNNKYFWFYSCLNGNSNDWCENTVQVCKELSLNCNCENGVLPSGFCPLCDCILNGGELIQKLFELVKNQSEFSKKQIEEFQNTIKKQSDISKKQIDELQNRIEQQSEVSKKQIDEFQNKIKKESGFSQKQIEECQNTIKQQCECIKQFQNKLENQFENMKKDKDFLNDLCSKTKEVDISKNNLKEINVKKRVYKRKEKEMSNFEEVIIPKKRPYNKRNQINSN